MIRLISTPGFCLAACFAASGAHAQMRISMPPAGSLCVVQAGQSNGRGSAPIGKDNVLAPRKRNYMLTLGGHWQQPVFEPTGTTQRQYGGSLASDIYLPDKRSGYGSGRAIVEKLVDLFPARNIIYLNVSIGGQPIAYYLPGGRPYQAMTALVMAAKPFCASVDVIWTQGESDAHAKGANWQSAMQKIWAHMTKDWGAEHLIIVQLGDTPAGFPPSAWRAIQAAQLDSVRALGENKTAALVKTAGLKKENWNMPDGETEHYIRDSYDMLGETIARTIMGLRR